MNIGPYKSLYGSLNQSSWCVVAESTRSIAWSAWVGDESLRNRSSSLPRRKSSSVSRCIRNRCHQTRKHVLVLYGDVVSVPSSRVARPFSTCFFPHSRTKIRPSVCSYHSSLCSGLLFYTAPRRSNPSSKTCYLYVVHISACKAWETVLFKALVSTSINNYMGYQYVTGFPRVKF